MFDLNRKIKLVAVSYLNTKPFLAGIQAASLSDKLDIIQANPSDCAELLIQGGADIALIPVASIPSIPNANIISNYCIGATGKVGSVCLYSECPLEEIESVMLDYQSKTSVALCRLLFDSHWKKEVNFIPTGQGYINQIKGKTAGLVIGDRSFPLNNKLPYCYDLSEAWMTHKQLPFVFACWVSRVPLSADFLSGFDSALALGLDSIPALAGALQSQYPEQDVLDYFTNKIDYVLDEPKRIALDQFYQDMGLQYRAQYAVASPQIHS